MSATRNDPPGIPSGELLATARRFLDWWRAGLTFNLPPSLDTLFLGDRRIVRVAVDDAGMRLRLMRTPHAEPKGAASELSRVVAYGLPQWTPFTPDEVYVAARIGHVAGDRALVDLDITTRSSVAPMLRQIEAAGISPDALVLPSGKVELPARLINRRRRCVASRVCDLTLLGAAICLAIALASLSHTHAVTSLERLRSTLRSEIGIQQEAARLSAEVARMEARHAFLAERIKREVRFTSSAIAAAAVLPAEAEVEELTWTPSSSRFVLAARAGNVSPAWGKLEAAGKLRAVGKGAGDRELREWTVQSARTEP